MHHTQSDDVQTKGDNEENKAQGKCRKGLGAVEFGVASQIGNNLHGYGGDGFQANVAQGAEYFNQLLSEVGINSVRGRRLVEVFRTATRMETAFWQQGLDIKQELN